MRPERASIGERRAADFAAERFESPMRVHVPRQLFLAREGGRAKLTGVRPNLSVYAVLVLFPDGGRHEMLPTQAARTALQRYRDQSQARASLDCSTVSVKYMKQLCGPTANISSMTVRKVLRHIYGSHTPIGARCVDECSQCHRMTVLTSSRTSE